MNFHTSRIFLCFIVMGLLGLPTRAQNILTQTFVARDQTFKFDYAPSWQTQDEGGYTLLAGQTDQIPTFGFFFFSPALITRYVGTGQPLDVLLNRLRPVFAFIIEDARLTTIAGRNAAAAAADIGNDNIGFAFLMEMSDGRYGLALAIAARDYLEALIPLSVLVLETYDTPTYNDIVRANVPITPIPETGLENDPQDNTRLIAELELAGIIAPGSRLVYQADVLDVRGKGTGFNRPELDIVLQDMVMMGELAFTPSESDDLESCGILARVAPDLSQYLEIGLDSSGNLYYFDASGSAFQDIFSANIAFVSDFQETIDVVLIVRDETLIVYLNGIVLANSVRVNRRAGSFGVVMRANTAATRCEFRHARVYELAGTCNIVADNALNLRAGPGLAYESVGFMEAGETRRATAYHFNTFEDLRWWQLDNAVWVREDVVTEVGGCNTLPPAN